MAWHFLAAILLSLCGPVLAGDGLMVSGSTQPLTIGESFTLDSSVLSETRRINVYLPAGYAEHPDARLPVLYMPDGGIAEDFLHVAGLLQVSNMNSTVKPFLLVGIENTQRRRDLTPPTDNAEDRKYAPEVGGSAAFRAFLRDELMPEVNRRYRTTDETAIVGESLAGLFIVETFVLAPELFDHYLAFDPSLWWNDAKLVDAVPAALAAHPQMKNTLWLASSDERGIAQPTERLAEVLSKQAPAGLRWKYVPMPAEHHWTIYHPAALQSFREVFAPPAK